MAFPLTEEEHNYIEARIQEIPELIVAAAVRYGHQIVFVERPARHHDSFVPSLKSEDQYECGFVTSRGRFVGRKEAGEIVMATGQGTPRIGKSNPNLMLFSEDMWHDSRFEGDFADQEYKEQCLAAYAR